MLPVTPFRQLLLLPVAGIATLFAQPTLPQGNFFEPLNVQVETSNEDNIGLLGWLVEEVSFGLQDPGAGFARQESGVAKIETRLFLQYDTELADDWNFRISGNVYHDEVYRAFDSRSYSTDEINVHRNRYQVRDFYLEHETDNGLYFKLGNQIVAWGQAEYLRVTDLVNTEDQFTFAQQDLEDLRLQVPAALASLPIGDWQVEGVITWEAGLNQLAPERDEFDPYIALRQRGIQPVVLDSSRKHEAFLRVSRQSSQGDVQFVVGEFNNNIPSGIGTAVTQDAAQQPVFLYQAARNQALGVAGNRVSGPWLAFAEAGLHKNRALQAAPMTVSAMNNRWESRDQWLAVFGLEYSGFENLLLSVEIDSMHTRAHTADLWTDANQTGFGARFYWTALNERLQVSGVWNELPDAVGQVSRLSSNYDWSDSLSFGLLWVGYKSKPDSLYALYDQNDVLQLQLRYNFQF